MSNIVNINRRPEPEIIFVERGEPCAICGWPGVLEENLCRFCRLSIETTDRLASKIIYTAGYARANFESFRARVWDMRAVVVDIRYSPTSGMREWRKAEMSKTLGKQYRHIIELGNENYNKRDLPIKIANLKAGIDKALMIEQPVVLLCGCPRFRDCHRRLLHEPLTDRGCFVQEWNLEDEANFPPLSPRLLEAGEIRW